MSDPASSPWSAFYPAGLSLQLVDLRVAFADRGRVARTVLDIAAFNVAGGMQIGLCGPSGSGKTTLLNLLAGLQKPQRGTVHWSAVELTALGQRALDRWRRETVGLVFQECHLFPGLSALGNVLLPLRFAQWSIEGRWKRRAFELLERVGVPAHGNLQTLSRGEMQRVAVARALLRAPAIVLADEPTASLDLGTGRVIADLLSTLCREAGATLIIATHDLALADRLDESHEIVGCRLRPRLGLRAAAEAVVA
jgi:putative ABC transport system ATP-binding protein